MAHPACAVRCAAVVASTDGWWTNFLHETISEVRFRYLVFAKLPNGTTFCNFLEIGKSHVFLLLFCFLNLVHKMRLLHGLNITRLL